MGWLSRLFGGGGKARLEGDGNVVWIYARCDRCGSVVAVRVNARNDIGLDEDGESRVLHKEIMDAKCFQLMRAEIHFDPRLNIITQELTGGKFISRAEYAAARGPSAE